MVGERRRGQMPLAVLGGVAGGGAVARGGERGGVAGRHNGVPAAFRGVSEMGGGNFLAVDFAHLRLPAAGGDHLHRDRVAGEGMREIDALDGVEPFCGPAGGVVEHQSVGLLSGHRGAAADVVNRRGGHQFQGPGRADGDIECGLHEADGLCLASVLRPGVRPGGERGREATRGWGFEFGGAGGAVFELVPEGRSRRLALWTRRWRAVAS